MQRASARGTRRRSLPCPVAEGHGSFARAQARGTGNGSTGPPRNAPVSSAPGSRGRDSASARVVRPVSIAQQEPAAHGALGAAVHQRSRATGSDLHSSGTSTRQPMRRGPTPPPVQVLRPAQLLGHHRPGGQCRPATGEARRSPHRLAPLHSAAEKCWRRYSGQRRSAGAATWYSREVGTAGECCRRCSMQRRSGARGGGRTPNPV